jgi:hypothetical protein
MAFVCIYNVKKTKVLFILTFIFMYMFGLLVMCCNFSFIQTYQPTLYDQLEVMFSKLTVQNTVN